MSAPMSQCYRLSFKYVLNLCGQRVKREPDSKKGTLHSSLRTVTVRSRKLRHCWSKSSDKYNLQSRTRGQNRWIFSLKNVKRVCQANFANGGSAKPSRKKFLKRFFWGCSICLLELYVHFRNPSTAFLIYYMVVYINAAYKTYIQLLLEPLTRGLQRKYLLSDDGSYKYHKI